MQPEAIAQQRESISRWLGLFVSPESVFELRAIRKGAPVVERFVGENLDKAALRAAGLDATGLYSGIYFTPNPLALTPGKSKGGATDADVRERRWLLVDIDPVRPADLSSTDAERATAWEVCHQVRGAMEELGLGGTVLGDSGNGWHLCWPILLPNDEPSKELVHNALKQLGRIYSTEAVKIDSVNHNASRIWKLYGSTARKGTETKERPHRRSQVIDGDPWDSETADENTTTLREVVSRWIALELRQRASADPVTRAKAYLAKEPPAIAGKGGSNACFHVACILIKGFALSEQQAFQAIADWNAKCEPPWSEAELLHKFKDAAKRPGPVGELLTGSPATNGTYSRTDQAHSKPPAKATEHKPIDASQVATLHDLIRKGAEVNWLWPGWIPRGVLTVVAASGGTGKTRFCTDLLRRMVHGLPWPDGTPMGAIENPLALWVVADNHHDEMVTLGRSFGVVDQIRINASPNEPYEGVALDTVEDLRDFEERIMAVRPTFVVIDTVGNSTDRNLSRQEDAKAYYQPLQGIARRCGVAMLCLTHLNAGGQVLGKRAIEKVRLVIQLENPNADQGNRRRLWVSKSNSKYPAILGVTMGDSGNEYDLNPPKKTEPGAKGGGSPDELPERLAFAVDWLRKRLEGGAARVMAVRSEAEAEGINARLLYRARDALKVREYKASGTWWELDNPDDPGPM